MNFHLIVNSMPIFSVKYWRRNQPALALLIGIVLLFCSQPEMIGVNTCGIVATGTVVQNTRGFGGNWTTVDEPTKSMCFDASCFLLSSCKHAVALSIFESFPKPTAFCFFYVLPKSIDNILGATFGCQKWVGMNKPGASQPCAPIWCSKIFHRLMLVDLRGFV